MAAALLSASSPESAAKEDRKRFPEIKTVLRWRILRRLGYRAEDFFADGGVFDQLLKAIRPSGLTLRSSPRKRGPRAKK